MKAQVLVDFITEMVDNTKSSDLKEWAFFVDCSPNLWGSGASIILEGVNNL